MNPIPLSDPQGRIWRYACSNCGFIPMLENGRLNSGPVEREVSRSLEEAAGCCICRRCGAAITDERHWNCKACRDAESARWEAGRPERDAQTAKAEAEREQALSKALDRSSAILLEREMSRISEEYYCAGWLIGLEFTLWTAMQGGPRTMGSDADIEMLRDLSARCGGWWRMDEFLTLAEWEPIAAQGPPR